MIFLSLLLAVLGSSVSLAAPTISAQNAIVDALVYALPLSPYVSVANAMSVANASNDFATNTFAHATTLANASFRTVVLPNTDTLYSAALLDLSAGDVVVTMPERELGRFYVLPFYDLYGNNVCSIGTVTNSTAGKYLIQYQPSNAACDLIPDTNDGYAGTISLPTVYGAILLRIEVFNSSDVDHIVSTIQPHFTLTSLNTPSSGAPPLTSALLNDNLAADNAPLHLLQLLSRVASFNPAEEASDAERVATTLKTAGISVSSESYTQPPDVDLASAYNTALNLVQQVPLDPANLLPLGSSSPITWSTTLPSLSGDFHARYDIHPAYTVTQEFYANQTYMVEFRGGKPDVRGFWSLTVYAGDGFLVPNAGDRYSLGDRGSLTYPDGTPVYTGNGNRAGGDWNDSRGVLYAAADWLPTPADGAEFMFILRFYGPTISLTDGTYQYPKITAVDANPPLPISE